MIFVPPIDDGPLCYKVGSLLQNSFFPVRTLKMAATQSNSKRPTCPSCSKPAWLCLCTRLKTPGLENSVSVTILQHCLEKKHPLNSARIAKLGLKNVSVATVADVNMEAQFFIQLLDSESETGSNRDSSNGVDFDQVVDIRESRMSGFEYFKGMSSVGESFAKCSSEINVNLIDTNKQGSFESHMTGVENTQNPLESSNFVRESDLLVNDLEHEELRIEVDSGEDSTLASEVLLKQLVTQPAGGDISTAINSNVVVDVDKLSSSSFDSYVGIQRGMKKPVITATIGNHGEISSFSHVWMSQSRSKKPNFSKILEIPAAHEAMAKGFIVQKIQKQQLKQNFKLESYVEFEIEIPSGSVLLFPTEEALTAKELEAINCDVKNLIVLDGTWAKARRIYAENPWLKLLPHLKLDLDKVSLYRGVRLQPKVGYLSTIESIVYALKAVGNSPDGLDNLLEVFDSMVEDQRQCKKERLSSDSSGKLGCHS